MATLTVRDVPPAVIRALKKIAKRNRRSMQQEVLNLLISVTLDRESACRQVEEAWGGQNRSTTKQEVDQWIRESRP
jgi:plasmid stability protein